MMDAIIEDILPNALMIGIDYNLFWTLNPKTLEPFRKAFFLRQQYDSQMAWLNGIYIRHAIASCLSKQHKYPVKPIDPHAKTEEERMLEIRARFLNNMKTINKRFEK